MPRKLAHVSARRIAANRQNALESTGPKAYGGKANSRTNALKHGLFAMDLYINSMTEWENPDEYEKLLDRLKESYQPVGLAEELEVQQIAACWWKGARARGYENAEIAMQLCVRNYDVGRPWGISSGPHRGPSRPHRAADQHNALNVGSTPSKNRSHSEKSSAEEVRGDGA